MTPEIFSIQTVCKIQRKLIAAAVGIHVTLSEGNAFLSMKTMMFNLIAGEVEKKMQGEKLKENNGVRINYFLFIDH